MFSNINPSKSFIAKLRTFVFVFSNYEELPDMISAFVEQLTRFGGHIKDTYTSECTHLVTQYQLGDAFEAATKAVSAPAIVTAHWLQRCLLDSHFYDPSETLLDRPFPADPVPGADQLIIAITGYEGSARIAIKDMITVMGASYTGYLSSANTHLICLRPTGAKYEKANEWKVKVVNHLWLEDAISDWKIPSETVDTYASFGPHLAESVGRRRPLTRTDELKIEKPDLIQNGASEDSAVVSEAAVEDPSLVVQSRPDRGDGAANDSMIIDNVPPLPNAPVGNEGPSKKSVKQRTPQKRKSEDCSETRRPRTDDVLDVDDVVMTEVREVRRSTHESPRVMFTGVHPSEPFVKVRRENSVRQVQLSLFIYLDDQNTWCQDANDG